MKPHKRKAIIFLFFFSDFGEQLGTSLINLTYVYLTDKEFWQLQKQTHPNDGLFQSVKAPIRRQIGLPVET